MSLLVKYLSAAVVVEVADLVVAASSLGDLAQVTGRYSPFAAVVKLELMGTPSLVAWHERLTKSLPLLLLRWYSW